MFVKHGTGQITNPDDTGQEPIVRTASKYFTEEEWAALLAEAVSPRTTRADIILFPGLNPEEDSPDFLDSHRAGRFDDEAPGNRQSPDSDSAPRYA